jgi:hypothetical protein
MLRTPDRWRASCVILFLALALALAGRAQSGLSLKEVLSRNLQASGGKAKLGQVKNLSFKTGGTRTIVSAAGELKVLSGKDPVITEAILVRGDKVQRKSLSATTEITGLQKTVYQTLAKLYAGLFSMAKFEGQLKLEGLKSYGPETFYHLTTKSAAGPVRPHFYLRADDFFLKRLVFQGTTPEGDKYEVNYDFAPFEETGGIRLPLTWYASQVGTRGNTTELTEVKTNQPLEKGFFTKLEINAGKTSASPGEIKGNVLDFNSSPFGLAIATNWTRTDTEKAGFKSGDKLILLIDEDEYDLTFYALANEMPAQNELAKGARLLAPMGRGGDNYSVLIIGGDTAVQAKLKVLAPLSLKKTGN